MSVPMTDFSLKEHMYIKEMNQSLFNTYLEDKNSSSFELYKPLSSADITSTKKDNKTSNSKESSKPTCACKSSKPKKAVKSK